MRLLEFRRQFSRIEVLADMGQSLLQFVQRIGDVAAVGNGDVSPHRIGSAGNAGQVAERAAPDVKEGGTRAEFLDQRRGQRG